MPALLDPQGLASVGGQASCGSSERPLLTGSTSLASTRSLLRQQPQQSRQRAVEQPSSSRSLPSGNDTTLPAHTAPFRQLSLGCRQPTQRRGALPVLLCLGSMLVMPRALAMLLLGRQHRTRSSCLAQRSTRPDRPTCPQELILWQPSLHLHGLLLPPQSWQRGVWQSIKARQRDPSLVIAHLVSVWAASRTRAAGLFGIPFQTAQAKRGCP